MDEIRFLESACMYEYIKVYIKVSILKYSKLHNHESQHPVKCNIRRNTKVSPNVGNDRNILLFIKYLNLLINNELK